MGGFYNSLDTVKVRMRELKDKSIKNYSNVM